MKEAAKLVGVGLPRLYTRLREKGLFTQLGIDGRNLPTRALQREGLFHVEPHSFYVEAQARYVPCPKVNCTYKGLILLQEIADELAKEKEQPAGERSGLHDPAHGDQGPGAVLRTHADPGAAGRSEQPAGSNRSV
jgi:hypothetical protein